MDFDSVLNDIESTLADVRLALRGQPIENKFPDEGESDEYFMVAMDVYEALNEVIEGVMRIKYDVVSAHIHALEVQLQNKLERG